MKRSTRPPNTPNFTSDMNVPEFIRLHSGETFSGIEGYLRGVSLLHGANHPDWKCPGMEGLILTHGSAMTPRGQIHRVHNTPKACFQNAYHIAARSRGRALYVEGYACTTGIPIHHAWICDEDGNANDPTLGEQERMGEYYGIAFRFDFVRQRLRKQKHYGVFGDWGNRDQHDWMRSGEFPQGAVVTIEKITL